MDILVCGGGIAGLTLALCLVRHGHRPVIVEKAPQLLEHWPADADLCFDAVTHVEIPRWHVGQVVLVGDACQCVSLLAGQGASMAMFGAHVQAQEIAAAGANVEAVLTGYERRVKPAAEKRQAAGRGMASWFVPGTLWRSEVRDLIMRAATWPAISRLVKHSLLLGSRP